MIMKNVTSIDQEKLSSIIKTFMDKTSIINTMCLYIHKLFQQLDNHQSIVAGKEYKNHIISNETKLIVKKIYHTASILASYVHKDTLYYCYLKFMQTRIINLKMII